MLATNYEPLSPEWWRERLLSKLSTRRKALMTPRRYFEGRHPAVFERGKVSPALVQLFEHLRVNMCELLVEMTAERCRVEGFRFGAGLEADSEAWDIWQANSLDLGSTQIHEEALVTGFGPVMVWPGQTPGDAPRITVETADQVITERDPANRRVRMAALKSFMDDVRDLETVELYLPDRWFRWTRPKGKSKDTWQPDREVGEDGQPNPIGRVPVVELTHRAGLAKDPSSIISGDLITLQNALNRALGNLLVAGDVAVFAQKWVTGMEIPTDPATNQPMEPFKAAIDRLWISENPDTKFGAFPSTDLDQYGSEIDLISKLFASKARVPAHYILNMEGQWPTGDSLRAAEKGLTSRARAIHTEFGEGHEEVIRLAFLALGDTERAGNTRVETLWADPETRTQSELADALVKEKDLMVPLRRLWAKAGYTQSEIEQFEADFDATAAMFAKARGVAAPPAPAPEPAPQG